MNDQDRAECMDSEMREWFENLTPERRAVITARMEKQIVDTVGEWDEHTDPVLVEMTFFEIVNTMYTQSVLDGLVEKGHIYVSGINDDGELLYTKVDNEDEDA